jgi:hypothetical protein
MDIGYVILLLLVLVYGATAAFLYLRARREQPGPEAAPGLPPEVDREIPPEEPEVP